MKANAVPDGVGDGAQTVEFGVEGHEGRQVAQAVGARKEW
jgi:hypothetical protein